MKGTISDRIFDAVNLTLLTVVLIVVLYPLVFVVSASFSDPGAVGSGQMWLFPVRPTLEAYRRVFNDPMIWIGYRNTVVYVVVGTLLGLFFNFTAAYPMSRRDFPGKNLFMIYFMVTMFFSGGLIPTYLLMRSLQMINKIWALVLPGAVGVSNIIIIRTFFNSTIPYELQEAALIDGSSNIGIFIRIILPLSKPILAVMALFYGVGIWNNFFSALIYINDKNLFPLALVLRDILIISQFPKSMIETPQMMEEIQRRAALASMIKYALIIVSTLPVILVYPFLQRYFIKGIMIGAIKG